MMSTRALGALLLIAMSAACACAAPPVVSNVVAHQRTDGSKKVDIYYNLADSDTEKLSVSVKVSDDGGATYAVNATSLSGDVGGNVSRGTGKHIVWDCGADIPGAFGTNYKVCVTGSDSTYDGEMIYIPAGSFLMGNSGVGNDVTYGDFDEFPQHSVYLSGYWIGKYEVTRGEYRRFMEATGRGAPAHWAPVQDWDYPYDDGIGAFTQTDKHPVVGVTYHEAEAFCNWAGGHLPTEAQWEKAARWTGSYPNVYPWGNAWDAEKCNIWDDHNAAGGGYGKWQTAPVGSYPSGASPYGCQDMAGNVWEWVQDWFRSYPGSTDPFDYTGGYRVLRSGSWSNFYGNSRCATRIFDNPSGIWYNVGFRVAR